MTARLLEVEAGLTVIEAGSGEEALALCATQSIVVVVTDMVMPRMGGRDLGRQIRAQWPQTQLLFVTGFTEVDPEGLPGELLVKPYPFDQFVATVQALADRYWRQVG
jgi:DNA-binding response OmpR family regulator